MRLQTKLIAPQINPRAGEPLQIKGKTKPRFKAGAELTDKVN